MGYPPPTNGPPPLFPFQPGDDIAAAEAAIAAAAAAPANTTPPAPTTSQQEPSAAQEPLIVAANAANALVAAAAANLASVMADPANAVVPPHTTIAAGSSGATLPQATIDVASTSGWPTSGYLKVDGSLVYYGGKTSGSFTGCSGGTATLATGDAVVYQNVPIAVAQIELAAATAISVAANQALAAAPASTSSGGLSVAALCAIFEKGLSAELGGGGVGVSANTPAVALTAGASAGIKATCCGFTLDLSLGFLIDFQFPTFGFSLSLLLPYLGFSLSCDPTKPVSLVVGVPWGGGRVGNAEPDPDDDENAF